MRITSKTTLTKLDLYAAERYAQRFGNDIHIDSLAVSPRGAITFYCVSYNGTRRCNGRDGFAATWSAWGYLIAELFNRDPSAIIGQYRGREDFIRKCREWQPAGQSIAFLDHLRYID